MTDPVAVNFCKSLEKLSLRQFSAWGFLVFRFYWGELAKYNRRHPFYHDADLFPRQIEEENLEILREIAEDGLSSKLYGRVGWLSSQSLGLHAYDSPLNELGSAISFYMTELDLAICDCWDLNKDKPVFSPIPISDISKAFGDAGSIVTGLSGFCGVPYAYAIEESLKFIKGCIQSAPRELHGVIGGHVALTDWNSLFEFRDGS